MLMTMTPFRELVSYVGFTLSFFTAMGVASLFYFRRQPGWQKLGIVSFCWPVIPILFLIPALWMVVFGIYYKPYVSLAGMVTMITGAMVYHLRLRSRKRIDDGTGTVETY